LKNPLYIGKLRWRGVEYDGQHDGIISTTLYDKAMEVLAKRNEDLKGRQFNNGQERVLSGVIRCGKCNSHVFGGGGLSRGVYVPYYVCSKRHTHHSCDQDYIRAELLEQAVFQDVRSILTDEQLMARVWEEANRQVGDEKPDIEKQIAAIDAQASKARSKIDRYFEAFENGSMAPALCNKKVEELQRQLDDMEGEKEKLESRRKKLEVSPVDHETLKAILEAFDKVAVSADMVEKKHLLQSFVKKVLIHDRETVEIWYTLPNRHKIEVWDKWLPKRNPVANLRRKL